jgi:hypothetical protein
MLAGYELACQRHIILLSVSRPVRHACFLPCRSPSFQNIVGVPAIADVEKWQPGVLVYMQIDSSIMHGYRHASVVAIRLACSK